MINSFGKLLVLIHTVFSIAAMAYATLLIIQPRDLGWKQPAKDPTVSKPARRASEIDRSIAAVKEAHATRDLTYFHVKPAIDSIRDAQPYLYNNHIFYVAEIKRLRTATEKIKVQRLKNGGFELEKKDVGKPAVDDAVLADITQSNDEYEKDLKKLQAEQKVLETEVQKIVSETKRFTNELTGTDDANMYVQPGLYTLIELEYKAQTQLKEESKEIRPYWSEAIEQSRLFTFRRADLEATLQKLKGPTPKGQKKL
jgi:hypothetical protein